MRGLKLLAAKESTRSRESDDHSREEVRNEGMRDGRKWDTDPFATALLKERRMRAWNIL